MASEGILGRVTVNVNPLARIIQRAKHPRSGEPPGLTAECLRAHSPSVLTPYGSARVPAELLISARVSRDRVSVFAL